MRFEVGLVVFNLLLDVFSPVATVPTDPAPAEPPRVYEIRTGTDEEKAAAAADMPELLWRAAAAARNR